MRAACSSVDAAALKQAHGDDLEAFRAAARALRHADRRAADLDGDKRPELVTTSYYGSPSLMLRLRQESGAKLHEGWKSTGFLPMQTTAGTALAAKNTTTGMSVSRYRKWKVPVGYRKERMLASAVYRASTTK